MSLAIFPPGNPIIQNFLPPADEPPTFQNSLPPAGQQQTGQSYLPPIGVGNGVISSTPATSAFAVTGASGNTSSQFAQQTLQALFALQAGASNLQINGGEGSGSEDSTLAQNFLPPAGQQPTVQNFLPPTAQQQTQTNGGESSGSGDSTSALAPSAAVQPGVGSSVSPPAGQQQTQLDDGESAGSGGSTSAQNFLPPAGQQPTVQNFLPPAGQQQTQINGGEDSGSGDLTSAQNFLPPAAIPPASGTITPGPTATSTSNGIYAQFSSQTLQTLLALQADASNS
jgi:hypothetical protein